MSLLNRKLQVVFKITSIVSTIACILLIILASFTFGFSLAGVPVIYAVAVAFTGFLSIAMNLLEKFITSKLQEDLKKTISSRSGDGSIDMGSPVLYDENNKPGDSQLPTAGPGKVGFFSKSSTTLTTHTSWIPIPVKNKVTPFDENWKISEGKSKEMHYKFKEDEYLIYIACRAGIFGEHFVLYLEGVEGGKHFAESYELLSPGYLTSSEGYIRASKQENGTLSTSSHPENQYGVGGPKYNFALVAVVDSATATAIRNDVGEENLEENSQKINYDVFSSTYKKFIPYSLHDRVDKGGKENCLTWGVKFLKKHGVEVPSSSSIFPSHVVKSAYEVSINKQIQKIKKKEAKHETAVNRYS